MLFGDELRPLIGVQLALDGEKIHLLLVHVADARDRFVLLLDRLGFLLQVGAPGIDLRLQFPLALVELLLAFIEADEFRLIFLQAFGDFLVAGGNFFGAAMELLLQRLAGFLALDEIYAALLLGLAFEIEASLRLRELSEPALQDPVGIGALLAKLIELLFFLTQAFFLGDELALGLFELTNGRFHRGAAFDPLLAIDFIRRSIRVNLGKAALGLLMHLRQLGLAGFLAGSLFVELLLAGASRSRIRSSRPRRAANVACCPSSAATRSANCRAKASCSCFCVVRRSASALDFSRT